VMLAALTVTRNAHHTATGLVQVIHAKLIT
jgi:hypothetical protein